MLCCVFGQASESASKFVDTRTLDPILWSELESQVTTDDEASCVWTPIYHRNTLKTQWLSIGYLPDI